MTDPDSERSGFHIQQSIGQAPMRAATDPRCSPLRTLADDMPAIAAMLAPLGRHGLQSQSLVNRRLAKAAKVRAARAAKEGR